MYAKFFSRGRGLQYGGSIYIIMHAYTSTSELDIEISSIEHVQVITGSEDVSAAGP